ncbi:tetraprenyl-beta-curcumene synthase family protein [Marinococcus luteus]|uniref:tetraprenyl-beta-curcumene synthase family protein n=1 Tax=Marinococcus luteus TaxID=1122204 RepID=UPI002ACCCE9E|nr:tetraprenyl-beta-curcumene synthase family protein [Marinococcus luteus]MDZ5783437.1 tetraprenyl-beta-curcumene synthase family protein [Marinococcus luteus]
MSAPTSIPTIMYYGVKQALPAARQYLSEWKHKAEQIPDDLYRQAALEAIDEKTFHYEGGSLYALIAPEYIRSELLRFIVAYQNISDYLDSICDMSQEEGVTFYRDIHEALKHALDPGASQQDYLKKKKGDGDGGFLADLVETCQSALQSFPGFSGAQPFMEELSMYYREMQIYKHIDVNEREAKLIELYEHFKDRVPPMTWYEFCAASGSTLGIYALAGYAARSPLAELQAKSIKEAHFPYVQGMHILLDYFIDQEEDVEQGSLNFTEKYASAGHMMSRLEFFKSEADKKVAKLPEAGFHKQLNKGLLSIYLSDEKVQANETMKQQAKHLLRFGGITSLIYYWNSWMYRKKI